MVVPLNVKEVYNLKIKVCILSVFLSVLLLFSNLSVKANDVVFPSFPLPVEGMSSTHYLIFRDNEYSNYFLVMPLDPAKVEITKHELDLQIYCDTPSIIYTWHEGESSWEIYREINTWGKFNFGFYKYENGIIEFLYSSFDLYYNKNYNEGNIFFQKAPIKATFLHQMRGVKMGAVMTTLVGLIPLLIVLLISLMGFRKAWAWLLRVLRTA